MLGEGEERKALERKRAKLGLTEDFVLLGAVENPYPYYARTDVYVHATRFEGKSLALQEALALGCAALIYHLAELESFGVPYLAPFTTGTRVPRGHPSLFRLPLPRMKWRDGAVKTQNRRNQR